MPPRVSSSDTTVTHLRFELKTSTFQQPLRSTGRADTFRRRRNTRTLYHSALKGRKQGRDLTLPGSPRSGSTVATDLGRAAHCLFDNFSRSTPPKTTATRCFGIHAPQHEPDIQSPVGGQTSGLIVAFKNNNLSSHFKGGAAQRSNATTCHSSQGMLKTEGRAGS